MIDQSLEAVTLSPQCLVLLLILRLQKWIKNKWATEEEEMTTTTKASKTNGEKRLKWRTSQKVKLARIGNWLDIKAEWLDDRTTHPDKKNKKQKIQKSEHKLQLNIYLCEFSLFKGTLPPNKKQKLCRQWNRVRSGKKSPHHRLPVPVGIVANNSDSLK